MSIRPTLLQLRINGNLNGGSKGDSYTSSEL